MMQHLNFSLLEVVPLVAPTRTLSTNKIWYFNKSIQSLRHTLDTQPPSRVNWSSTRTDSSSETDTIDVPYVDTNLEMQMRRFSVLTNWSEGKWCVQWRAEYRRTALYYS